MQNHDKYLWVTSNATKEEKPSVADIVVFGRIAAESAIAYVK